LEEEEQRGENEWKMGGEGKEGKVRMGGGLGGGGLGGGREDEERIGENAEKMGGGGWTGKRSRKEEG
jgi:hypothetical protein